MVDQKINMWATSTGCLIGLRDVKTAPLSPVVAAFEENAVNALRLSQFPSKMFKAGSTARMAELAADIKLYDKPYFEDSPGRRMGEGMRYLKMVEDLLSGAEPSPFKIVPGVGWTVLEYRYIEDVQPMYDSLMRSQILLSWGAFETMAGDLWEATLNYHPQTLAALKGKARKPDGLEKKQQEEKSLPIWQLEKYRYDLSKVMGTVLRRERFTFAALPQIQYAYEIAFGDESPVGKSSFWENPSLIAISAVRNLIVHRAGIVDEEFLKKRGTHPALAGLKLGEKFFPDGAFLQDAIYQFFSFTEKLILEVDRWLVAHPP